MKVASENCGNGRVSSQGSQSMFLFYIVVSAKLYQEKDDLSRLLLLSRGEFEAFFNQSEIEKNILRNEIAQLNQMVL